ncbi:MAG: IS30 family transposase, partial [Pseudomonadota bacterium]
NGRLRIDLPRKTNLHLITNADIQEIANLYNKTPRKCLGYQTPSEVMLNEIKNQRAALGM